MPLDALTAADIRDGIVIRMLGRDIPLTDLTTISALRIFVEEAIVEELASLHAGLAEEFDRWFIQTARGAQLDRRLADFDLSRPGGEIASGVLEVTVSADDTPVPAGAQVETPAPDGGQPRTYAVLPNPDVADGSWTIDQPSGQVRIAAAAAGAAGNTAAGTITVLRTSVANVVSVTNPQPLINGRDQADDDAFCQYFRDYLAALTRGPRDAIIFAITNFVDATGIKPVHSCALVEWGGQTLLNLSGTRNVALVIYIEDGSGTASPALVDAIQHLVDGDDTEGSGLRAAGVPTEVRAAATLPVPVDVLIDADRSANPIAVEQGVDNAVREYLGRLPVGGQLISGELQGQLVFAQLFRRVMDVPGVLRARFTSPTADVGVPIGRKVMPADVHVAVQAVP